MILLDNISGKIPLQPRVLTVASYFSLLQSHASRAILFYCNFTTLLQLSPIIKGFPLS